MSRRSEANAVTTAGYGQGALVLLLALVMSACLMLLFVVGSFGPRIMADLGITRAQLGMLVTVTFGVASITSLGTGLIIDAVGARTCLLAALALVAASLWSLSIAGRFASMLGAAAVGGLALALVNPVTNKMILTVVPPARQGLAMGIKQSGVPFAGLLAGGPLTGIAAAHGWRLALQVASAGSILLLTLATAFAPRETPTARRVGLLRLRPPNSFVTLLMIYSLFVGGGIAALNTYLPLYAHERLGLSHTAAAHLLAVVGAVGVAARIAWTMRSDGAALIPTLGRLGWGGALAALLLAASGSVGSGALWLGGIGLGAFGVAANAVSMFAVIRHSPPAQAGHASALVSLGFFAGFIATPVLVGGLVDAGRAYTSAWGLVAAQFALAGVCAVLLPARVEVVAR